MYQQEWDSTTAHTSANYFHFAIFPYLINPGQFSLKWISWSNYCNRLTRHIKLQTYDWTKKGVMYDWIEEVLYA